LYPNQTSKCKITNLAMAPVAMGSSTNVESSLQIALFMQNKANFKKSQVNVTTLITKDYENKSHWTFGENKPKIKPNKANPLAGCRKLEIPNLKP